MASLSPGDRIRATVDEIPPGRVASYSQVAAEAGLAGRARLVGHALRDLPARSGIPWHRVVNAAGSISPRGGGEHEQREHLLAEGVEFDSRGRIDLDRFGWRPSP